MFLIRNKAGSHYWAAILSSLSLPLWRERKTGSEGGINREGNIACTSDVKRSLRVIPCDVCGQKRRSRVMGEEDAQSSGGVIEGDIYQSVISANQKYL